VGLLSNLFGGLFQSGGGGRHTGARHRRDPGARPAWASTAPTVRSHRPPPAPAWFRGSDHVKAAKPAAAATPRRTGDSRPTRQQLADRPFRQGESFATRVSRVPPSLWWKPPPRQRFQGGGKANPASGKVWPAPTVRGRAPRPASPLPGGRQLPAGRSHPKVSAAVWAGPPISVSRGRHLREGNR